MRKSKLFGTTAGVLAALAGGQVIAQSVVEGGVVIGERPVIGTHVDQSEIDAGALTLEQIFDFGDALFEARFNALDGQGRPGSTGAGAPRVPDEPAFVRSSAPDSNACTSCHLDPGDGGNGDFAVNVFVLAQALDPVTFDISGANSNSRNTIGMNGAGAIEMLAREMTSKLHQIRADATATARANLAPETRALVAKGVSFGYITVYPNGQVNPALIQGVDWDLIIKPFHQKGAVVSLREFTNNAMNHHHGMQSVERFGADLDPDLDGHTNELTVGDITATTIYQAALPTPARVFPPEQERRDAISRGADTFNQVGCNGCHRPYMALDDPNFYEPNPYNPPGNANVTDIATFAFDMTSEGQGIRLKPFNGGALVRAFTDLKRHNLCDNDYNHFCNEQVTQGSLVGYDDPASFIVPDRPRPTEEFLTRRLWDAGSSDPYGHVGDLTTLTEAISEHGGDARVERDSFFALPEAAQADIIEFLKSMQIVL